MLIQLISAMQWINRALRLQTVLSSGLSIVRFIGAREMESVLPKAHYLVGSYSRVALFAGP